MICTVLNLRGIDLNLLPVQGAGGLSSAMNEVEGRYAFNWAKNIWADALA